MTEVNQPDKAARRRHGKTDAVDAEAAARAVLSGRATAAAKTSDGPVEMLRLFKLAKASAIKSRTQAINQLKSVLVSADPALRESLAGLTNPHLFKRCAELRRPGTPAGQPAAARHTLRLLARRIQYLTEEIDDLNKRIAEAVEGQCPRPARRPRRRPGQRRRPAHRGRRQPRSPQQRGLVRRPVRHQSGRAVLRQDPATPTQPRRRPPGQRRPLPHHHSAASAGTDRTQDYLQRRLAEGKTRREIIRCLKRYIAREIYRLIVPTSTPANSTGTTGDVA